jgi:ubiquitin C-terminal hydrolase
MAVSEIDSNIDYIPKIGKCGIRNIGNTCFMNSVLQLVLHCKPLVAFLIKKNMYDEQTSTHKEVACFEQYLHQASITNVAMAERKRLKLDDDATINIRKCDIDEVELKSVTVRLAEILNSLVKQGLSVITPTSFKQMIDLKVPKFRQLIQHDAPEFLEYLLDIIIEETGIECEPVINNVPASVQTFLEMLENTKRKVKEAETVEEKKALISQITEYKKANRLILLRYEGLNKMINVFKNKYNPFIFQLRTFLINYIECLGCHNINTNYESITMLQLEVDTTLEGSFKKLIANEVLENNYKCAICGNNQSANKYCKIWRTPSVLFIHLKRFINRPDGKLVKINSSIEIPEYLNLNDYCDDNMSSSININRNYKLKGFSNHHGGYHGGHYTADCACIVDNTSWYHFDDSRVSKYQDRNISTDSAYILMYELVNE